MSSEAVVRVETTNGSGGAIGSGFAPAGITGVVITAYHVVEDADDIFIRRGGAGEGIRLVAELVAFDEFADVAVLRTVDLGVGIPIAQRPPQTGEEVIAVGFPLGLEGDVSVSQGIVSRSLEAEGQFFIQHDAEILRGNSGGPLISETGEVLGINIAVLPDVETVAGLNFATQAGEIAKILQSAGLGLGISIALPTPTPLPTPTNTPTPTPVPAPTQTPEPTARPSPTPLPAPSPTYAPSEATSIAVTATERARGFATQTVSAFVSMSTATAQAQSAATSYARQLRMNATATALAIIQTTSTVQAVIEYCDSRPNLVIHAATSGSITRDEFIGVPSPPDKAEAVNFDASVTFFNTTRYSWSYGLMFRRAGSSDMDMLVVAANALGGHFWAHHFVRPGDDAWIQTRREFLFTPGVRAQPRESNEIRVVASGRKGTAYLNDRLLGTFNLDAVDGEHVEVMPAFGFYTDSSPGTVSYENFIVTCPG